MRYIHFIVTIVALFVATSCFVDDIDQIETPSAGRDEISVVARVARFDDRVVDTRGTKNDAEANVTCMAVAIFPIEDGEIGDCVFYDFRKGSQLLFTINRQEKKNGADIYNVDKPYVMYVFANLPSMTEETCANMSLDQMKAMAYSVDVNSGVGIPKDGFPMIGSLGDAIDTNDDKKGDTTITPEGDGKTFILKPGSASNPTLPLVNGDESDLLNVPMKAMFSKVNFSIKVTPDQTVDTHLTPQFTLKSYSVHNVPASVDFAMGGKPRLNHSVTDDVNSVIGPFKDPMPLLNGTNIARGTQTINFTFYLPERYLTPTYQSHDGSKDGQQGYYNYPFPVVGGKYRAEDLDLRQRFKPLLPDGQDATYVTINGTFRDHQQHEFNVTYDVYLGEDNYGNFDTERNCEYYHYINIRGILNSDDQVAYDPTKEMPVSIDHRVNVTRVEPIIINLRHETMLDSHFEVRPLRIRKNPEYTGDLSKAKVKVEVIYDKTPAQNQKWVGLERSFGNGTTQSTSSIYLVEDDLADDRLNSLGKRKYFTTDLTTNTLAKAIGAIDNGYSTEGGQSVIVPITNEDEAVWIYVDEALVAEAGDATRKATIRVTVAEDGTNYGAPIDYVMQQRQLFPVKYVVDDNGTPNNPEDDEAYEYLIEYEEEYLHNFDADDSYGQTDFEGMQWGLPGIQLSYDHRSISFDDGLKEWLTSNARPYYDFYISKYDAADANNAKGTLHEYEGYNFCNEIIQVVNGQGNHDTDTSNNIDVLHLGQDPKSAVEYCYNKNKRNANGQVATSTSADNVKWYLPGVDEIEDIFISEYGNGLKTYSLFDDFQNKFYWSCQPAFIKNFAYYQGITNSRDEWGAMYVDNVNAARATKVYYLRNNNFDYARSGIKNEKDANNNDIYYEAWQYVWGGIIGTEHYTSEDGTVTIDRRITITLRELEDQIQEGYKPRTSYARVRCVRKK